MFDVLIENGEIVDGSGQDGFCADIGIKDGKIAAIGNLKGQESAERVEAAGLTVAPGFVDIHCHSDSVLFKKPREQSKILQGVTTETIGNCGLSAAPVNPDTLELLQKYTAAIFAGGKLDFEAFQKKAEVQAYPGNGYGLTSLNSWTKERATTLQRH